MLATSSYQLDFKSDPPFG